MKISKREIQFIIIGVAVGAVTFFIVNLLINKSGHQHIESSDHQAISTSVYTCSMHPQIRQNEPGKCPLCGMDLIPVTQKSDKGENSPFIHTMSPEAIALANVQTQKVKTVSAEHEVYLTGKIAINEQKLAVITANYSGRIEKLFIDFTGQTVSKGQKLATIYSPELVTAQKELIKAVKFKEVNPALYNASKEKLRLWKINEKQINEIETSGVVLTEFDVYADQSGVVIRRYIAKGDYVSKGSVLFEIADLSNVWVLLDAYESDLAFMKVGQKITLTVASLPGKEFTTNISFIDPLINPQSRTAAVRAELNNTQQLLKPEMFVKGKIKANLSVSEKSLVIPKTALLWTGKRSIVYVKVPNSEFPSFEMREITIGASLGDYYIVESGLSEGEEIVTNGVFAIDGAAQLNGNYSMMNRAVDNTIAVPDKFSEQLTDFVNQYFELKNSLVKSDFQLTQTNTKKLETIFNKIDMKLLDEEAHSMWMEQYSKLKKDIGQLQTAKDIEKQREIFSDLSNQIIEIAETFGLKIETVYVAYCPMALDDKGAFWLSEKEEINNPYFGDKMLRCGEVKKKIRTKSTRGTKTNQPQGHQH
ncbi:efflux RND transporter periplasmic adaptor subunit [Schleiferia thermophila]|uniref:efflux RND transporter periplasmic adaptor subunit n=1 Tax=Schleiferia thermophila TaxID=884107 RepID=UPI003EF005F4